jgi:hypothetical protein
MFSINDMVTVYGCPGPIPGGLTLLTRKGLRWSPGPPVTTTFVLGNCVLSATKEGPFMPARGAEPIIIWVAVRELVAIVLAVIELVVAESRMTLEAMMRIMPEFVSKRPDEFVIVLVARRFAR